MTIQRPFMRTIAFVCTVLASLASGVASATPVSGTITFQGNVVFAAPIAGIALSDMTVSSGPTIDHTGNGEKCEFTSQGSASVDGLGAYGSLAVGVTVSHNGMGGGDPS